MRSHRTLLLRNVRNGNWTSFDLSTKKRRVTWDWNFIRKSRLAAYYAQQCCTYKNDIYGPTHAKAPVMHSSRFTDLTTLVRRNSPPSLLLWLTSSELWWLSGSKKEDYQNCSVLYCVLKLCTVISTLRWAVLTVLWIGFCHTGPISLCV